MIYVNTPKGPETVGRGASAKLQAVEFVRTGELPAIRAFEWFGRDARLPFASSLTGSVSFAYHAAYKAAFWLMFRSVKDPPTG